LPTISPPQLGCSKRTRARAENPWACFPRTSRATLLWSLPIPRRRQLPMSVWTPRHGVLSCADGLVSYPPVHCDHSLLTSVGWCGRAHLRTLTVHPAREDVASAWTSAASIKVTLHSAAWSTCTFRPTWAQKCDSGSGERRASVRREHVDVTVVVCMDALVRDLAVSVDRFTPCLVCWERESTQEYGNPGGGSRFLRRDQNRASEREQRMLA
jgi:hypothetical protein